MISILVAPPGVTIETSSPTCLPSSALPTGDSSEMRPLLGSASAEPTIVNASSPYSSWTFTVEPAFDEALLVLGVVVLGVLIDVAEFLRLADALGNLGPTLVAKHLELRLQA